MGIDEALQIFDISDILEETDVTLKKKYRKLMTKYHPDVCGDDNKAKDIALAYEFLKDAMVKLAQYKLMTKEAERYNILIPLSKLVTIYNGGTITVGSNDNKLELNNKNIRKHNLLILSDVTITHNGITDNFSNIQPWDVNDNYEVNCVIYVDNLDSTEDIKIQIDDSVKNIQMLYQSLKLRVTLEHNISVSIVVSKKIHSAEGDKA
ncbi:MAG: DnaJ domain-containing protein [Lachnospiraceae bacterium]|nr:DnaJ domain-containing protein [Lachnospiraceae bacterium]